MELLKSDYWLQTYTSGRFDFKYPSVKDVNIVDVAHALSMLPRFTGHGKFHYTIAQHSLTMCAAMRADKASRKVALAGLMHDAHEAYIGDISSPFKLYLQNEFDLDINEIEKPYINIIEERFEIDLTSDEIKKQIKYYDSACLRTEAESLFERIVDGWATKIELRLQHKVKNILTPMEAKQLFIGTFKRLKKEEEDARQ